MKRTLTLLVLALACFSARAQDDNLPQVFSPNAAELGKYGKIPVSYFNGLPNISIPLTELRAKNYTLPVYLTYHAGGNKPDQHPGWVGLGWTLHAGGCINRIVNGLKDEEDGAEEYYTRTHEQETGGTVTKTVIIGPKPPMDDDIIPESLGPGLFHNWSDYHYSDWSDSTRLDDFARNNNPQDFAPDEFQINVDGLNASFYFDDVDRVRIVSQTGESFKVSYTLATQDDIRLYTDGTSHLDAHLFTYIDKLVVTKGDGVQYVFGGDLSSIDFSYKQYRRLDKQRLVGTANTWYLTEIRIPGGETVRFHYVKSGFPIAKYDVHNKLYVHWTEVMTGESGTDTEKQEGEEEVYTRESDFSNLSLTILHPSYLRKVESTTSGDYLYFDVERTDELESDVTHEEFVGVLGGMSGLDIDGFLEKNRHYGLARIDGPHFSARFEYRGLTGQNGWVIPMTTVIMPPDAPEPKDRLRLERVIVSGQGGTASGMEYGFTYHGLNLPHSFTSKMTDHWGYYNGTYYGNILKGRTKESDTFYGSTLNSLFDSARKPNAYRMQAEILQEISWPTGGVTKFEYEPHEYNRVASCYDTNLHCYRFGVQVQSGMAGGLRIRSVTDSLNAAHVERRTYEYNGSGILSGKPLYGATGTGSLENYYTGKGLFGETLDRHLGFTALSYRMGSEQIINQLSPTSGNHVTYGTVTERFSDGSSVTYRYSDHETVPDTAPLWTESNVNNSLLIDPVTSMQLGRGLLLGVEYRNASGDLVKKEAMTYAAPTDSTYLLSIEKRDPAPSGKLKRVSVNRQCYDYPALVSRTVQTWPEEGGSPITETETYAYTPMRRLRERTRVRGTESEGEHMLYAEDIEDGVYPSMSDAGWGGRPVETIGLRNGQVVSGRLMTWRQGTSSSEWLVDSLFSADLPIPVDLAAWNHYAGTGRSNVYKSPSLVFLEYDAHGNPLSVMDRSGRKMRFGWDARGMNQTARSDAEDFLHLDFEGDPGASADGWQGGKAWPGLLPLAFVPPSGAPCTVDYRIQRDSVWLYERKAYTGAGMVVGSPGCPLDEVRVYPDGSLIDTFCYDSPSLLRSRTDGRGVSMSYAYDWSGRLSEIRDNDGNLVTSWTYRYRNDGLDASADGSGMNRIEELAYLSPKGSRPLLTDCKYDGLGRPVSLLRRSASQEEGTGVYEQYGYDTKGRKVTSTVPQAIGRIRRPVLSDYSETVYDDTPLDRVKEEYGPGKAWRTGGHRVRYDYLSNGPKSLPTLCCRKYAVDYPEGGTAAIARVGFWQDGTLDVVRTTDEDGAVSLTFTDMLGRKVLDRSIVQDGTGQEKRLDTYYLYDAKGNLAAVLPPALSSTLETSPGSIVTDGSFPALQEYAYLYRYDGRDRCIAKRLPGCEWSYYVYDESDRMVLSQDGNDRAEGRWRFSLTDMRDRECVSGRISLEIDPFSEPLAGKTVRAVRPHPLDAGGIYGYSITGDLDFGDDTDILSVNWYDDYGFLGKWGLPSGSDSRVRYTEPSPSDSLGARYTLSADGLLTGRLEAVLGKSGEKTYLWNVDYYDAEGRLVQHHGSTHLGGTESESVGYSFTGQPVCRRKVHRSSTGANMIERYAYTYDNWDRPVQTVHILGSGTPVVLSDKDYDGVGRLSVDRRNGQASLLTTYSYNVRSWLTGLSVGADGGTFAETLSYESPSGSSTVPRWGGDLSELRWRSGTGTQSGYYFGYDGLSRLVSAVSQSSNHYDTQYTYDLQGNVTSIVRDAPLWSSAGKRTTTLALSYTGNRLTDRAESVVDTENGILFPDLDTTAVPAFVPEEGLAPGLEPVVVAVEPLGKYAYDATGRMTRSVPDAMSEIRYNVLGLPERVVRTVASDAPEIVCSWYTAGGTKLRSGHMENDSTGVFKDRLDYVGNLVYRNGKLDKVLIEGGYIGCSSFSFERDGRLGAASGTTYTYRLFVTDHQGNVRAVADTSGHVSSRRDYYPFGMEHSVVFRESDVVAEESPDVPVYDGGVSSTPESQNRYWYSGKEWDGSLHLYDFSARLYDPVTARFTTMDPLCEKYYSISPYAYCHNNPVNRTDPDGCIDKAWLKKGAITFGSGTVATAGGAVAVGSGVGTGAGAYFISTGIPAMGLGAGMMIAGLFLEPTPESREMLEQMPTSVHGALSGAADKAMGNKNHEIESIADLIDAAIGFGTLQPPKNVRDVILNGITMIQAGREAYNAGKNFRDAIEDDKSEADNSGQSESKGQGMEDWKKRLEENLLWTP